MTAPVIEYVMNSQQDGKVMAILVLAVIVLVPAGLWVIGRL